MCVYYKYPRTYHLPWSLGSTNDDKIMKDTNHFNDMTIVLTEKMDGENTNMYSDKIHARSIDSNEHHPSRRYVNEIWGRISHEIPDGWRICGENLYAKHSIYYENLDDYFLVFSIWDENNVCMSWDDTVDFSKQLGLCTVPVFGVMDYQEEFLKSFATVLDPQRYEGYVLRNISSFPFEDYHMNTGKYVRKNHVTTDEHWMYKKVIPNKLRS